MNEIEPVKDIFTATYYVQQLIGAITKNALLIGQVLKPIKEGKLYKDYATGFETWGDYCREIRLSRSTADYLVRIWEVFGLLIEQDSQIEGIDHSRLIQALPYCKSKEDAEKWLGEAQSQDPEGYRNCLRIAQGKASSDECNEHIWNIFAVCENCGKKERRDE